MTPKEKAQEMVNKMYNSPYVQEVEAKRCAEITVDEIIKSREDDGHFDDTLSSTSSEYYTAHPMYLTYWLEVRKEIKKL